MRVLVAGASGAISTRLVTAPYTALLAELSPASPVTLHTLIVTATITGTLTRLCAELNQQHGPAAFTRLFKAPEYTYSLGFGHRQFGAVDRRLGGGAAGSLCPA